MRKRIELLGLAMVIVFGLLVALTGQASATAGTSHGWKYVSGVGLPDVNKVCNSTADQMPGKFKDSDHLSQWEGRIDRRRRAALLHGRDRSQ